MAAKKKGPQVVKMDEFQREALMGRVVARNQAEAAMNEMVGKILIAHGMDEEKVKSGNLDIRIEDQHLIVRERGS